MIAGAELPLLVALDRHARGPALDHEEADALRSLDRERLPGVDAPLRHGAGDLLQLAVLQVGEQLHSAEQRDGGVAHRSDSTAPPGPLHSPWHRIEIR